MLNNLYNLFVLLVVVGFCGFLIYAIVVSYFLTKDWWK